jgi:O-acetyl-ADP-ribose deacetylase (regulator of RNase III)
MHIRVVLVDVNPKMVSAWHGTFEENPEVTVVHGSMLEESVSAWVSPTNSGGRMDGGLDAVIKGYLGHAIEKAVQKEIGLRFHGAMPVGHATCVPTGRDMPRFLISTPTMVSSSEDVSDTMNVALAAAAAFQVVHMQNAMLPGSIRSIALPGLGAATGRVPPEICADLMWTAYDLFREAAFTDFAAMRKALEEILGDLGPTSKKGAFKKNVASYGSVQAAPKPKIEDVLSTDPDAALDADLDDEDFDDEDDD